MVRQTAALLTIALMLAGPPARAQALDCAERAAGPAITGIVVVPLRQYPGAHAVMPIPAQDQACIPPSPPVHDVLRGAPSTNLLREGPLR